MVDNNEDLTNLSIEQINELYDDIISFPEDSQGTIATLTPAVGKYCGCCFTAPGYTCYTGPNNPA